MLCVRLLINIFLSLVKQRVSRHRTTKRLAQDTLEIRKNDYSDSVKHGWSSQISTGTSAMPLNSQKQNVYSAASVFSHCLQKLTEI